MKKIIIKNSLLSILICFTVSCGNNSIPNLPSYYEGNTNNEYNYTNPYVPNLNKTRVYSQNLKFRQAHNLITNIVSLQAELIPKNKENVVIFDDVNSYFINIYKAKVWVEASTLNILLNEYVFNYPNCPLSNIEVSYSIGKIKIKGKMKKIINIPFEMEGRIEPTFNGLIQLTPDSIKANGIPVKGLMDLIGMDLASTLNLKGDRGIKIDGNKMVMEFEKMFPPPVIKGKIVGVDIDGTKMTLMFDNGSSLPRPNLPDPNVSNYMYITGSNVKIMNQTHTNANLMIIDMDQSDPMDYYMKEFKKHLKAGYIKLVDDKGTMVSYSPDYEKIK